MTEKKNKIENNDENSCRVTLLPVEHLKGNACNTDAHAAIETTSVIASRTSIGDRLQRQLLVPKHGLKTLDLD